MLISIFHLHKIFSSSLVNVTGGILHNYDFMDNWAFKRSCFSITLQVSKLLLRFFLFSFLNNTNDIINYKGRDFSHYQDVMRFQLKTIGM